MSGGWDAVREAVRQRVGSSAFEAWFRSLSGAVESNVLVLRCPDRFSRDWIRGRYGALISEAAPGVQRVDYQVDRALGAPAGNRSRRRAAEAPAPRAQADEPTFETFVSGPNNALALEAARGVARGDPGLSPLVLSGRSGLGKTHLCLAIRADVGEPALYRSAEEFTTEVTRGLRGGQMEAVRRRYRRSLNVLVLEDIQFLTGKRATQVELFHTLDHLISHGKRVVLSADRLPHELEGLDEGLRSRIASGLIARLSPPDLSTRTAILREKATGGGCRIPEDCLTILASRPVHSVRDLISGLNQVVARSSLLRTRVTVDLVQEALQAVELRAGPRSLEEVLDLVARASAVSAEELRSRTRRRRVVRPRQFAMYLCRRYTEASLPEIGRLFGRDPASVRYAIEVVEKRVVEQPQVRYELEALATRLSPGRPARTGARRTRGTPRT
jgi:chromosomal replication initiator protein